MKKMFVFILVLIVVGIAYLHPVQAYSWLGHEILTPSTTRFYRHTETKGWGEQHDLLKVSVDTEKFFIRTLSGCHLFKMEIYKLYPNQTFEEVSSTFSNGSCDLFTTINCDTTCVSLPQGDYIFKIIIDGKQKGEVFTMVFGPPVRS